MAGISLSPRYGFGGLFLWGSRLRAWLCAETAWVWIPAELNIISVISDICLTYLGTSICFLIYEVNNSIYITGLLQQFHKLMNTKLQNSAWHTVCNTLHADVTRLLFFSNSLKMQKYSWLEGHMVTGSGLDLTCEPDLADVCFRVLRANHPSSSIGDIFACFSLVTSPGWGGLLLPWAGLSWSHSSNREDDDSCTAGSWPVREWQWISLKAGTHQSLLDWQPRTQCDHKGRNSFGFIGSQQYF